MLRRALLAGAASAALVTGSFVANVSAQSSSQPATQPAGQDTRPTYWNDGMHGEPLGGTMVNMNAPNADAPGLDVATSQPRIAETAPADPAALDRTATDENNAYRGYYTETAPAYASPSPVPASDVTVSSSPAGSAEMSASAGLPANAAVVVIPRQGLSETDYVREAAAGDQYEIQAGQIALQRSQSDQVRSFAQQMIDQHTQSSATLAQAANQAGLQPVSDLPPAKQAMLQRLRDAPQDQFDEAYMRQQVTAHMNAAALHEGFAQTGSGALQQAALSVEPTVQSHLDSVYAMSDLPTQLARARDSELTQVASNDTARARNRTYRGYHVVGPSRGEAGSGALAYGGSATASTSTGSTIDSRAMGTMPADSRDLGSTDMGRTTSSSDSTTSDQTTGPTMGATPPIAPDPTGTPGAPGTPGVTPATPAPTSPTPATPH